MEAKLQKKELDLYWLLINHCRFLECESLCLHLYYTYNSILHRTMKTTDYSFTFCSISPDTRGSPAWVSLETAIPYTRLLLLTCAQESKDKENAGVRQLKCFSPLHPTASSSFSQCPTHSQAGLLMRLIYQLHERQATYHSKLNPAK